MPLINLKLSGEPDMALAHELAGRIGRLTKDVLNKSSEVTAITVSFIPCELWFVARKSLAELNKKSFHLSVKFGESTTLKVQKAHFIESIHSILLQSIDNLHPVSYTTLEELRADAYGYNGLTVENIFITGQNTRVGN